MFTFNVAHIFFILARLLLLLCFFISLPSWAQQEATYGQYFKYPILANPAYAGLEDVAEYFGSFRQQWVGISDAPTEIFVAAHFRLRNKEERDFRKYATRLPDEVFEEADEQEKRRVAIKHGLGGTIYSEQFGGFRTQCLNAFYAVHYPLNDDWKVSLSVRAGASIYSFNGQSINVLNEGDQTYNAFVGTDRNRGVLDVDFSTRLDGKGLFLGYTATQLPRGKIFFGQDETTARLSIHHFLMAGYKIEVNDRYTVEPTAMVRYVSNLPLAADFSARLILDEKYWAALGTRDLNALLFMAGGKYMIKSKQYVSLSYSYEHSLSEIGKVAPSTHEIVLGMSFY